MRRYLEVLGWLVVLLAAVTASVHWLQLDLAATNPGPFPGRLLSSTHLT